MAAQTVSVNRNLDDAAIAGLLNGEGITVNTNATLTIDSDNRWSQQAAVLGSVTIDAVTGGKVSIDGTKVWQVPFSASAGNVPALGVWNVQNCTGQNTFSTGELLGVWATDEMVPRAAGGTMPTTGYVKFRSKVNNFDALGEVINLPGGATITGTNAGKRSWINITGTYQGTINTPRLGMTEVIGDWYELGTTSGAANQEFDYPIPDVCGGIQIETAPGSGIYEWYRQAGARWNSGTATLDDATGIRAKYFGQRAALITATTTNGSAVIPCLDTSELRVGMPVNASASFSNLALYILSIVPNTSFTVSSNANAAASTTFIAWRNKIKLAQSAGTIVGYLPASGCKVRCPNIKLSTSLTPHIGNILPTTQDDRYEFVTTSAGVVTIDTVDCGWYSKFSAAYSLDIRRTVQSLSWIIANTATTTYIDDCCNSYENGSGTTGLSISNCYGGGTITNSWIARYNATGGADSAVVITDCSDFTISNNKFSLGGTTSISRLRGNADIRAIIMTRCFRMNITNLTVIQGKINIIGCIDVNLTNIISCDMENGANPGTTNALSAVLDVNSASSNVMIDGYSFLTGGGVTDPQPYNLILATSTGVSNVEFRNAGTPAAPLNCGGAQPTRSIISLAVSVGVTLRRLYFYNTATSFGSVANTCQGVNLINCWCDGADSTAFAGINELNKGGRYTNSVTGQSAVYGNHWEDIFVSATAGRFVIRCNEPTDESGTQCVITAGTPKFTSTGNVAMPTIGDQVTWELPYFALGHTSLANIAPTLTGTNTGNFTMTFQYDTGAGYNGSWLALTGANLLAVGAINPATGIRFKVRATTSVANSTNALTYIRFDTVTNSTDQQIQYPLPVILPTLTISGIQSGSDVVIFDDNIVPDGTGNNVIQTNDAIAGTSATYIYTYAPGLVITVGLFKAGRKPTYIRGINLGTSDANIPVSQQLDPSYA